MPLLFYRAAAKKTGGRSRPLRSTTLLDYRAIRSGGLTRSPGGVVVCAGGHPEVYLRFGKCDGTIGRSNLHVWTTEQGAVIAGWLYELDKIAVSVQFAYGGTFNDPCIWHPRTGSNRFQIADFQYKERVAGEEGERPETLHR
jgi:hypothetical protein